MQSADIDVVALSDIDHTAIIGECKFKNVKTDKSIYETLQRRAGLISRDYRIIKYLLFSLSGYTDWYKTLTDKDTVLLSLEDLYRKDFISKL